MTEGDVERQYKGKDSWLVVEDFQGSERRKLSKYL
jgi:hypothetical protein